MKAIVNIAPGNCVFAIARSQISKVQTLGKPTDYPLSFEFARRLFSC
jgi:hypothetical protein